MHTKENEKERAGKVFIEIEEAYHLLKDANLDNTGNINRGKENIVETVIEIQLNIFLDKLFSKLLNIKIKHILLRACRGNVLFCTAYVPYALACGSCFFHVGDNGVGILQDR